MSELTAINAPSRPAALPVFLVSGVLALAFGIGVVTSAGRNRLLRVAGWLLVGVGVADMVAPFTPCTPVRSWPPAGPPGTTRPI